MATSIFEVVFLPLLAIIIGAVAAMLGIGGGVFIVPALQLLPLNIDGGFSPQLAAGTSLTVIVFKALSSSSRYSRQKRIDYRIGLLMAATTIPGAFCGAYLTSIIAEELLILIFALFLLYVASRMIFPKSPFSWRFPERDERGWSRRIVDSDGRVFEYVADIKIGLPLGFLAGISSGLLGIGGGSLMVPILHFVLSFPMHLAVATSVFTMVFTSISGVATHIYLGNVAYTYTLLLGIGVIFGAQIGAHFAKQISGKTLRRFFGIVLVIISLRMILKFLGLS